MKNTNDNQDPHYREYRERCQAGQKTEDDEEIFESGDDEDLYDEGYKGALKDFARAFGFSDVIPPMDSDTLLGHARQLTKSRQGYEAKVVAHAKTIQRLKTSLDESNELLRIARYQLEEWQHNRVGAKYGQNAGHLAAAEPGPK